MTFVRWLGIQGHSGQCVAVRGLGLVGIALLALGCSGASEVERSASSFCTRYEELADSLHVSARTVAPVENASKREVLDLAARAPDDELEEALRRIAELQPEVLAFAERLREGDATPQDVPADEMEQYVKAARVLHDERHSLCD